MSMFDGIDVSRMFSDGHCFDCEKKKMKTFYTMVVSTKPFHEEDWKTVERFKDVCSKIKEKMPNDWVGSYITHDDDFYTNLVKFKTDDPIGEEFPNVEMFIHEVIKDFGYENFIFVTVEKEVV